jgi:hypothetical protein
MESGGSVMPLHRIALIVALVCSLIPTIGWAENSTPPATPAAIACSIEPRPEEDLIAASSSPVAATPSTAASTGESVDESTLAAIQLTITEAEVCASEGDILRLAALYSDQAIASGVFSVEKVPITMGTPDATPNGAEPVADQEPIVRSATWLDDGRAVATIQRGDVLSEVVMAQDGDRWLIDSEEIATGTVEGGVGTPVPMDIPIAVLQATTDVVSESLGKDVSTLTITEVTVVEWPDAALGCPREGEFAAAVITPGYALTVVVEGDEITVHTDMIGNARIC